MPEKHGKIKEFFEQEAEKLAEKIERTPIEKFFIFFLVMVTAAALVMGYLQFKKNIESPLFPSYLSQRRAEERQNYLNSLPNTNSLQMPLILGPAINANSNLNQLDANSNLNINSQGGLNTNDLISIEQQLLSGAVTLKDLGIDNPDLQQKLDEIRVGGYQNINLSPDEKQVLQNLKNLTPAQIRDELIKQGVDKNTLDQISDEDLQKMFSEILSQYQQ
jgi:hypothetical protein